MHIFEFQHTTKVVGIIKRGFGDRFVQVIAPRVLSASHHNHELGFYGKDEPNKEVAVLIGEIILSRLKTYCRPRVLHDTKWNLLLIKIPEENLVHVNQKLQFGIGPYFDS